MEFSLLLIWISFKLDLLYIVIFILTSFKLVSTTMLRNRNVKKTFMRYIDDRSYKVLRFFLYVFIIFACHMTTAVLVQKVYKTPYILTSSSTPTQDHPQTSYFTNPFGIPIFTSTFALLYGMIMYQFLHHNTTYLEANTDNNKIKYQFIKLSLIDLLSSVFISLAIILSSFTIVNLILCCKLLAVVLFAVFFGKAQAKFRIGKRELIVAALICTGILVFFFAKQNQHDSTHFKDAQFGLFTAAIMLAVLMLEGYRPELVGQIRQQYSPPPSYMYYQVSKYTLVFLLLTSLVSTQLFSLFEFLWHYDKLSLDLTLISILEVIGNTFIYRLLILHKQHIIPMITTIRKLSTSLFNIYYFHHSVSTLQFFGLFIVAFAVLADFGVGWLLGRGKGGFKGLGHNAEAEFQKGWDQEEEDGDAVIGVI